MRVYVVTFRPVPVSLTSAVLDRVLAALHDAGHEVRVADLVADGFRAELSAAEHAAHRLPFDPDASPAIAGYITDLRWCETLVLVYPTWWSGQPAMLTGWLDRVLTNGVAWELREGATRLTPLLRNLRRIVVVTTHGSSKLVNAAQGEGGKRVISRAVRLGCHPLTRTTWLAMYRADRSSRAERQRFLDRVELRLATL